MARIWLPAETQLARALRGFGAPGEKPNGSVTETLDGNRFALIPVCPQNQGIVYANQKRIMTLNNGAEYSSGGISFDGSSSANCGTSDPDQLTYTDVHVRMVPNFSSSSNTRQGIFHFGASGSDQFRLRLIWLNSSNGFYIDTKSGFAYRAKPTFSSGDKIDLRFTRFDQNTGQFWFNGAKITTTNVADAPGAKVGFPTTPQSLILGLDQENSSWGFDGTIEFVRWGKTIYSDAEYLSVYRSLYSTLEPANQSPFGIGTAAAGGGVAVTVPQADLTLSTTAPTVLATANISIEIPQGNLVLDSTAPTISTSDALEITVPQADLVLSSTAPTVAVSANIDIQVPAADLVLSTTAPTAVTTEAGTIIIPQADLTLSSTAPTVSLSENVAIEVPAGDLTLSSTAPQVGISWSIIVPQADLTLSATAPSVLTGLNIFVPSADLALSSTAPTVSVTSAANITIPQANLTLSTTAPTVAQTGIEIWTEISAVSTVWTEI